MFVLKIMGLSRDILWRCSTSQPVVILGHAAELIKFIRAVMRQMERFAS